ncbi:hypothetical protein CH330_04605 [candidate division WOR-3 bacterium JGI_Cruoil_03_51_56]|uniref:DUF3108 domain-containing protein n=1 Tax=candidate division WOR-3 bacterium JGI_Cruoil_03_51_56 TaxID=1973747 RepID=A0A235BUE4_UNCW3|nr:MAG: hypothetical protein CH330_04605 [candidate division WOR-3 bacterium JGI_Cruoil_03_51_56]
MNRRLLGMLGIVILFIACPREEKTTIPKFVMPKWQDGETSVYHIIRNDSVLYESRVVLRLDEEFGTPTMVVTTTVKPVQVRHYFFDSSVVIFRRDSIRPFRSYRTVETDIGFFDIEAHYESGKVSIRKQSVDGVEEQTLKLPQTAYDEGMLQVLLRSVPLVPGTSFRIQRVVPIDMRILPVDVTVLGTKLVTTDLGKIMCREIVLVRSSEKMRFAYELKEPHRLIALYNPNGETEMLLTSYIPARSDTLEPVTP